MTLPPDTVPASATTSDVRLLVIEPADAAVFWGDFERGLAGAGFRIVRECSSVADAADTIGRGDCDLVVLDPGSDPRFLDELFGLPGVVDTVPILVVDGSTGEDVAERAAGAGVQEYLRREGLTPVRLERAARKAIARWRELRELRRDNALFRTMLDHVPDRIYFKDRQSCFIRVSRSVAEIHGVDDPSTLIGQSDFAFYPRELAEETLQDEQRVIETGEPIVGKVAHREIAGGKSVWQSTTKLPLRDPQGRIVGTFGITRDVTELKELELTLAGERNRLDETNRDLTRALDRLQTTHRELRSVQLQLIEAEKLKSIGRLAAGVAHEVKNPLAIVSMGIEFLRGRYPDDETTSGVLKELSDAVARADGVIKGMLDFSAPRALEIQECDVNAILRTALRLVRGEIRKDAHRVELDLGEVSPVRADRGKMCQVFVNLLTNALHAMPDGGALTVRTCDAEICPAEAGEVFHPGDRVVVVEIADTGRGIPADLLDRIFEPFVTTKTSGQGTGLGMSIVRSIMNLQRGAVTIRNGESGGAIATVTFRVNDKS